MSRKYSLLLCFLWLLPSACSSNTGRLNGCVGAVDTNEDFPFVEEWTGEAAVAGSQMPLRVAIQPLGPIQKPERPAEGQPDSLCENERFVSAEWTVELGDTFRHELTGRAMWNKGERTKIERDTLPTSVTSSLAPAEEDWPDGCTEQTMISADIAVDVEPDRLDLRLEWVRGTNCLIPLVELTLGGYE